MADLAVVTPNETTVSTPIPNTLAVGGDRFAAERGATYMLRIINGSGGALTVKVDDPTSAGAPGATTPQDPDLTHSTPATSNRVVFVNANRHRDSNGWVNMTYPGGVTTLTMEIYKVRG